MRLTNDQYLAYEAKRKAKLFQATDSHIHTGPAVEREADLHDQIEAWCKERGYYYIHSRMDRRTTTAKGVPDFVIFRFGSVLCVECKAKGRKPTPEQNAVRCHLNKLGHVCITVWSFEEFVNFTPTNP